MDVVASGVLKIRVAYKDAIPESKTECTQIIVQFSGDNCVVIEFQKFNYYGMCFLAQGSPKCFKIKYMRCNSDHIFATIQLFEKISNNRFIMISFIKLLALQN